jgi:hypothetical protein
MQITKLKLKGDDSETRLCIEYERETNGGKFEQCSIESPEAPLPSFNAALVAIVRPSLEFMSLWFENRNDTNAADGVGVKQVGFGDIGSTVELYKEVPNATGPVTLKFTAQHKRMPEELFRAVDILACEAMRYVSGERAQMELPIEAEGSEA